LEQAENVLRKRDAKLLLLEGQPEQLYPSRRASEAREYITNSTPATIIEEWQRSAEKFADFRISGDQRFIDPYVLERSLHGHLTRILIATREGQRWYDGFNLTDGPFIDALRMIDEGQTVFDCGAHHGINALLYSKMVGPLGHVVAFEPYPINLKIAELNARLNNRLNISLVNMALSSASGRTKASLVEQCIVMANESANDILFLDLAPLDQFAHLRPDFIKIDIEGAEIDALIGSAEILKQTPKLYIEIHPELLPRFRREAMEVFDLVKLDDYLCFVNYPGKPPLTRYELEFKLELACALFFIPKDIPPVQRYYTTHTAIR
jgi:FkbM family methyltransferase